MVQVLSVPEKSSFGLKLMLPAGFVALLAPLLFSFTSNANAALEGLSQ